MKLLFGLILLGAMACLTQGQANTKIFLQNNNLTGYLHMPSLQEGGTECSAIAGFPLIKWYTTVEVVDGSLTACGGYPLETFASCYSLSATLNVWTEFPSMDVGRLFPEAVVTPNGWWLTGGFDGDTYLTSTSLWDGTSWQAGPELPAGIPRAYHCIVQIDATRTFVAGGDGDESVVASDDFNDAYIYDWTDDEWTRLPNMTDAFRDFACTLYEDGQGGSFIVTAGGYMTENVTQILDLSNPVEWQLLPDLPVNVWMPHFVHDGDDLVIVNPAYGNLLRFDAAEQTFSVVEGLAWPVGFDYSTAVVGVSDASLSGCA